MAALTPMVLWTFDDGHTTAYSNAYPIARTRGIPCTAYVCTNLQSGAYMPWQSWWPMIRSGWVVTCHTHTHANLADATEAEIIAEMVSVNDAFAVAGLPNPEHHAYPYGAFDALAKATVGTYRKTGRGTSSGSVTVSDWTQSVDWFNLYSKAVYKGTEDNVDDIKTLIDTAVANGTALILYSHDVSDTPSASGCYKPLFTEICDYIISSGIEPVTIDTLYRAMQGVRTSAATGTGPNKATLNGKTTPPVAGKMVSYQAFVWGKTPKANPGNTAPASTTYDGYYLSAEGNYGEAAFNSTQAGLPSGWVYYRAGACIDGTWKYGEEVCIDLRYATMSAGTSVTLGSGTTYIG